MPGIKSLQNAVFSCISQVGFYVGHGITGYGKSCDVFLPLPHVAQPFPVAATVAGASSEEKGDRGAQLRAGSHKAAVCMAYWPDSPNNRGVPVSELINAHQLRLIPFMYPDTSWSGGEEGIDSCVSTYVRSGCQGGTGLPTQVQRC